MDITAVRFVRGSRLSWVAGQVFLVLGGVTTYFLVRGRTEAAAGIARAHATHLLELEGVLHIEAKTTSRGPRVPLPPMQPLPAQQQPGAPVQVSPQPQPGVVTTPVR